MALVGEVARRPLKLGGNGQQLPFPYFPYSQFPSHAKGRRGVSVAENFALGVNITLLGMGLVFFALILIAIIIWALDRLFRPTAMVHALPTTTPAEPSASTEEAEAAAALAAVMAAKEATMADEIAAIAAAIGRERQRLVTADPFKRAALSAETLEAEMVFVATIDPGPGIWRYQGRLKALQ
ncbi:MAG: OadG family protein [Chloroflexi bacterium]|nr:OadG family protein [Chloroflexota bacterium]